MTCGIYTITNTLNGKVYVGQSVSIEQRFRQHRSDLNLGKHDNIHLQRAWNRHGREAFSFAVLVSVDPADLTSAEQHVLDEVPRALRYNLGDCADSPTRGVPKSPETRAKMSASAKVRVRAVHEIEQIRSIGRGPCTPEKAEKIRAALSGRRLLSDEQYRANGAKRRGIPRDPDAVRRATLANKGRSRTPEQRARIKAGMAAARARKASLPVQPSKDAP